MKKFIILITILFGYQVVDAQDYQEAIEKARFLISEHQKQTKYTRDSGGFDGR